MWFVCVSTSNDVNTHDDGVIGASFVEYTVFLNAHNTRKDRHVSSTLFPLCTDLRNVV